jgi:Transposase DDE domain
VHPGTGAVVAAEIRPADRGDAATLPGTLEGAARHLAAVGAAPSAEAPAGLVADKGYHSRAVLKSLDGGPWKTRIAEPSRAEPSRAEPSRAEPSRAEPSRAEPSRAEPSRAEPRRDGTGRLPALARR